jgi:hypothetical protein
MPTGTYSHPLFGRVTFQTAHDHWVRGDTITFTRGFDMNAVKKVEIPQLKGVPGSHGGRLHFHEKGHAQLKMAFTELERFGLMKHIKTCAGSLVVRLRRPVGTKDVNKLPSNHAFGIAIDFNSKDGLNGATVAPVAPIFIALGFKWGQDFKAHKDPMHFEVSEFIANPRPLDDKYSALATLY